MAGRLGIILAVVLLGVAIAAPVAEASPRSELVGTWRGTLHQLGHEAGTVTFRISRPGSSSLQGRVRYSGLGGCSGRWAFLYSPGTTFVFSERITSGASATCKGLGRVTLRVLDRDTLAYRWTDGALTSRAIASRVR